MNTSDLAISLMNNIKALVSTPGDDETYHLFVIRDPSEVKYVNQKTIEIVHSGRGD